MCSQTAPRQSNLAGIDSRIDQIFDRHFSSIGDGVRPTQRKIIESILKGSNTLGLMPTGSGKSLCYWIAGIARGGVTLVVFPLTALMDEQASKLEAHGLKVFTLHSGISTQKQYRELIDLYNQRESSDFIFLSPERLASDGFLEFVLQSIRDRIKLVVVDEAHCISQWGLDFRPFYKEIPHSLRIIYGDESLPPVLCLTATLNPKDREQICRDFQIEQDHVIRHDMLLRPTIRVEIIKVANEKAKAEQFWALMEAHKHEKVLIYQDRKNGTGSVEELCEEALGQGFAAAFFHGDMSTEEKARVIHRFRTGELLTVFATSAFGMGIDIRDIRGVAHYMLTESAEQYYQQIGRVGRDGQPSWAVLYYSDKNIQVRKSHYIEKSFPAEDDVRRAFKVLTDHKKGRRTVDYFSQGDSTQSAYHYLVRSSVITPICKGLQFLSPFKPAGGDSVPEFDAYRGASKTGLLIVTARKVGKPEAEIVRDVYRWLAEGKLKMKSAPAKCLVIESSADALPDELLQEIMADVAEKKAHRLALFDQFVALLEGYTNTFEFHQAVGEYLGIDKYSRGRIHETLSRDMVRSKSEVIIANILFQSGIPFSYEEPLIASDGSRVSPDFTIEWEGKRYYWEHLGMLDREDYAQNWAWKKQWYETHFAGQLITTQESPTLSKEARQVLIMRFGVEAVEAGED